MKVKLRAAIVLHASGSSDTLTHLFRSKNLTIAILTDSALGDNGAATATGTGASCFCVVVRSVFRVSGTTSSISTAETAAKASGSCGASVLWNNNTEISTSDCTALKGALRVVHGSKAAVDFWHTRTGLGNRRRETSPSPQQDSISFLHGRLNAPGLLPCRQ